ncbi:hypothetical protein SAY87_029515 [Trapa incisa]|uniref:Gamma-glutamylcyclotransferase family protein n=1 Tax=Trapa incisa TaxID=236973 RepID=A0AAN7KCP0_9MYRT|nr:hypothetical protein SAY87_029515 [Trapa incisa]
MDSRVSLFCPPPSQSLSLYPSLSGLMANHHQSFVFTYGTLKKGFANHRLMQDLISSNDAVYLGRYSTERSFPLVCGPYGIPFLINLPGEGHRVSGELYAVSPYGLSRVDVLEGTSVGYYERSSIRVHRLEQSGAEENRGGGGLVIEAEAYFAHRSYGEDLWTRTGRVGLSEYADTRNYVKRADRPKGWTFIEGIRAFASSN